MKLFKLIETKYIDTGEIGSTPVEVWFSEQLQLYIEQDMNGGGYFFLQPICILEALPKFEADKIREQLHLNPADAIGYREIYNAGFTNLYSLNQLSKEEII